MKKVIISLCDYTGIMVKPWVDAGYYAVLVDPQHEKHSVSGNIERLPMTVLEAMPRLGEIMRTMRVCFVAGFPPCTDVAVSGSRWFADKAAKDKQFQAKAALVAKQCRSAGVMSGAPCFFENPVSVFSSIFGKPDYTFNPCDYTGYCAEDNYTKKTCLWADNGFELPPACRDESLGVPDDRIHKAPPGPERANFRSATPRGFARAVFEMYGK
jgi:hypothetical protein